MMDLKDDWFEFAASHKLSFDISICWHVPNRMRWAELGGLVDADGTGWTAHWLQRKLKHYLNKLDRRVLKSAHRNKHIKIWRLVTTEYAEGVGWHAHGLLATPQGHDRSKVINWATWMWIRELGNEYENAFVPHLVQASPTRDPNRSLGYVSKTLGKFNDDLVGTIDLENTHLPVAQ